MGTRHGSMPRAFVRCVKAGGRVRTLKPARGTVLPICIRNGKSHAGHARHVRTPRARR